MYTGNNSHIDVYFEIEKGDSEMKMEQNTEHTASNRDTDRQTGREENIQTRNRLMKTGKHRWNVREGDRGYYW